MEFKFGNTNKDVFGISYNSWKYVCEYYTNLTNDYYIDDIQLYPFYLLNKKEKSILCSKKFFKGYVSNGYFTQFADLNYSRNGYLLNDKFQFKDGKLISPILFLLLEALGKDLYENCQQPHNKNVSFYYTNNYNKLDYQNEFTYEQFIKKIVRESINFNYYINFDVKEYYKSVNLTKVVERIKTYYKDNILTSEQLKAIKQLIDMSGGGNLPVFKKNSTSRYIAMDLCHFDIDNYFYNTLSNSNSDITEFKLIRNSDDMFILFNINSKKKFKRTLKYLKETYCEILAKQNLTINDKKTHFGNPKDILKRMNSTSTISKFIAKNYSWYKNHQQNIISLMSNKLFYKTMKAKYKQNNLTRLDTYYIMRQILQETSTKAPLINLLKKTNRDLYQYWNIFCNISFMKIFEHQSHPLLSIIIPFYNRDRYLDRCIQSVLNQSYSNFEIILIDDGSTDNSLVIAESYAKNNKKIVLVHTKHSGTINARNMAFKLACGKYIVCVDSDDYIEQGYFENIYKHIKKHLDIDIIGFNQIKNFENKNINPTYWPYYGYSNNQDIRNKLFKDISTLKNFITCSILVIKKDLLVKHMCTDTTLKCPEDILYTYKCLYEANSLLTLNKSFYVYDKTNNTSTTCNKNLTLKNYLQSYLYLYKQFLQTSEEIRDGLTFAFIWKFVIPWIIRYKIDYKMSIKTTVQQLINCENEFKSILNHVLNNNLKSIDNRYRLKILLQFLKKKRYRILVYYAILDYSLLNNKAYER